MTITTRDGIIAGFSGSSVAPDNQPVNKVGVAGTLTAVQLRSLWTGTGIPTAGAAPTSAVIPTEATAGAIAMTDQTSPVTNYLGYVSLACAGASGVTGEIRDRLAHMGGLSGTVTTAQSSSIDLATLSISTARRGASNYSEVQWYLEWYTATGSTSVTATCAVVYDDASTANVTVTVPVSAAAGLMLPILPGTAGRYIKGVTSVTLSATTGTAGNFGVTATRARASLAMQLQNTASERDWALLGLPETPNDSCLFFTFYGTTTAPTLYGLTRIIHG